MSGLENFGLFGSSKRSPTQVALPKRWLIQGQSNAAGVNNDPTYSSAAIPAGVTVYDNNSLITTWGSTPGPAPYIMQELLDRGVAAADITIVIRAVNGATIATNTGTYFEDAVSTFRTLGYAPEAIFYWQGEAETQTEQEALEYEDDLVLLCGRWVGEWRDVNIYVMLMLHTDITYGAYYATTRASQVAAIERVGGCYAIDSHIPTVLAKSDQVHASVAGTEEAISRLFAALPS